MAKKPNQKLKLLYLMKILLERTDEEHTLTVTEMIAALEEFGIKAERKSIYDDIEALQMYGLDLCSRKSRTTSYYVASRDFELPELKLLVDAVQSSKFITHKKSNELIKKVEGLTSSHQARLLQRQVFVANRVKTMNESIYYNIDKIHAAISAGRKISYLYFEWTVDFSAREKLRKQNRKGGARYAISPWALTWDDENYYMIGFDAEANKIKHYRVDKMSDIRLTSEERDGQEHFERFDMAVYARKVFSMYGGVEETVRLRFANFLAGVVVDRFGRDVFLTPDDGDHFIITIKAEVSPQFLSWVFAFGPDVKILSPQSVIDRFRDWSFQATAQYEEERQDGETPCPVRAAEPVVEKLNG